MMIHCKYKLLINTLISSNMDLKDAKVFGTFTEDNQPMQESNDEDEEERKRSIMFSFGKKDSK